MHPWPWAFQPSCSLFEEKERRKDIGMKVDGGIQKRVKATDRAQPTSTSRQEKYDLIVGYAPCNLDVNISCCHR